MFTWTESTIALLGTMSDSKLAKQLCISTRAVYAKRTKLGIGSLNHKGDWTPENLALLGTMFDAELGEKMGIGSGAVSQKRNKLGIASYGPSHKSVVIPSSIDADLGKLSDAVIAKSIGVSITSVVKYRKRKGIKTSYKTPGTLPEEAYPLLGTETDAALAERFGVSRGWIAECRYRLGIERVTLTAEHLTRVKLPESIMAQLGTASDESLAKAAGVCGGTIKRQREILGIAPFNRANGKLPTEALALLGTDSDTNIARRFGTSVPAVYEARKRRGIEAYTVAKDIAAKYGHVLGTISDKKAAKIIGAAIATIAKARQSLDIPAFDQFKPDGDGAQAKG